MEIQHGLGAREVVFLGGEPTLHPDYPQILAAARQAGFDRIVVDSNGTTGDPRPFIEGFTGPVTIRFSFDGTESVHDALRGTGTFQRTLAALRQVIQAGGQVKATITLHAFNIDLIAGMVSFFSDEGIQELNFHFISWMGNARQTPQLGLTSASILKAQEELEIRHRAGLIPLRYPRLLVPESELQPAISQGLPAGSPELPG
jgi:MoaA/NifB/PqqE/SkfB family radical SAM enzyme